MKGSEITHWRGRRIDAMSREDLIDVVKGACALSQHYHDELNRMRLPPPPIASGDRRPGSGFWRSVDANFHIIAAVVAFLVVAASITLGWSK